MKMNTFFIALALSVCAQPAFDAAGSVESVSNAVFRLSSKDSEKISEAREELRQAGTNAIPWLFSEMRRLADLRKSNPAGTNDSGVFDRIAGVRSAFQVLGPAARPAIPELVNLLNEGVLPDTVAKSLIRIDQPAALTALSHALTNEDYNVKCAAANNLSLLGTNAESAMPILLETLHDTSRQALGSRNLRAFSANALGAIGQAPEKCVPALIESLHDESAYVRIAAIKALARFKSNADSALPALREISLKDTERPIRATAREAIREIQE